VVSDSQQSIADCQHTSTRYSLEPQKTWVLHGGTASEPAGKYWVPQEPLSGSIAYPALHIIEFFIIPNRRNTGHYSVELLSAMRIFGDLKVLEYTESGFVLLLDVLKLNIPAHQKCVAANVLGNDSDLVTMLWPQGLEGISPT